MSKNVTYVMLLSFQIELILEYDIEVFNTK